MKEVTGGVLAELASGPLADLAPLRVFRRGEILGRQGEPCEHLHILARGQVLLCRTSPNGADNALYLLGPGDLFAEGSLQQSRRWLVTARAVTSGLVHTLPAVHLPRLAQYYPQVTSHLVALLSVRLEWAHQRLDLITALGARERLLSLLRLLAKVHGTPAGSGYQMTLSLTQAEIGSMVGLARETVVRCLAEMEECGLVRRQGRHGFWVASAQPDPLRRG